jgi:hypothetical protein
MGIDWGNNGLGLAQWGIKGNDGLGFAENCSLHFWGRGLRLTLYRGLDNGLSKFKISSCCGKG